MNQLKRFWKFLHEDSWQSFFVSLIVLVIVIKFIFFPVLSLITGSSLPLVVIESCSLYHGENFDNWWDVQGDWYKQKEIQKDDFREFPFRNGMNKGDIIFVWGRGGYEIGDVVIFKANPDSTAPHPIIHRLVSEKPYGTKGDHNPGQLVSDKTNNIENIDETKIPEERIFGKAAFRVPIVGWIKLSFFEVIKDIKEVARIEERRAGDSWFCR